MTSPARAADDPADAALIARWQAGEERAATMLVERHASALARYVASLGVREEVEDVVQEAFIRAFDSLDRFRGESAFRTWLCTIARNLVRDLGRSRKHRRRDVEIRAEHAVTEHDALDAALSDESERLMLRAVAALSPTQRAVFTLRVAEGLSYKEIAAVVESTEGAARVHYHNAMRAIKESLDA